MAAPFAYVHGPDDYLVQRTARERFDALAARVDDAFSAEIINGFAGTVAEVGTAIARFREAVQTVGLFGGRKVVWFKDISFLADTPTGRAEGTLDHLSALQDLLGSTDPRTVDVILSASPVDRRRAFPKWAEKTGDSIGVGGEGEAAQAALLGVLRAEARRLDAHLSPEAEDALLERTAGQARLVLGEVAKLATWAGPGGTIDAPAVSDLTPNSSDGDFFEAAEAFYRRDLPGTLAALRRHFFTGGDARPLLASLQNRGRLLLQLRVLLDAGALGGGVSKGSLERAASRFAGGFPDGEKSGFNVFSQNPWYLSRLADGARLFRTRELVDCQLAFVRAFAAINRRHAEQEEILRALAVQCLGRSPAAAPASAA